MVAYRFDEFELSIERGSLQRSGIDVELRPKAFEVLRLLVENAGKLVSKNQLLEAVWPDVIVSDDSLSQCVLEIRRSLDDVDHRFIKTVPRRGYVFARAVVVPPESSLLAPASEAHLRAPLEQHRRLRAKELVLVGFGAILGAAGVPVGAALLGNVGGTVPLQSASIVPLMSGAETVIGQAIGAYPSGTPRLAVSVVPLLPGSKSGWHVHSVPLIGYVLEGEVTIDYGTKGLHVFSAGEAMLEAVDSPHNALNLGTSPARILVVYLGVDGKENSTPVPHLE